MGHLEEYIEQTFWMVECLVGLKDFGGARPNEEFSSIMEGGLACLPSFSIILSPQLKLLDQGLLLGHLF